MAHSGHTERSKEKARQAKRQVLPGCAQGQQSVVHLFFIFGFIVLRQDTAGAGTLRFPTFKG
jgi:hypothetical protein